MEGTLELSARAIEETASAKLAFAKFLSANDSGATGAHQCGVLISKSAMEMVFGEQPEAPIEKRSIRVEWQDDLVTESTFTWYKSKNELRLTRMGENFPYLRPDYAGALFVLLWMADKEYKAYLLSEESDIDNYLTAFSLGPQDLPLMFVANQISTSESAEEQVIREYVKALGLTEASEFPPTEKMSAAAREIQERVYDHADWVAKKPDCKIVEYTRVEYALFREMERQAYGKRISQGFANVDDFTSMANKVLNRRKSRAGKSFEHQLAAIFRGNGLQFDEQVRTEGNKTPDFVFPSGTAYHDSAFPQDRLVILAAKTTCKDRWRQILTEADRNRKGPHYLATLQQSNSPQQLKEMLADNVQLVVPKEYIRSYPAEYRSSIWDFGKFIAFVKEKESR